MCKVRDNIKFNIKTMDDETLKDADESGIDLDDAIEGEVEGEPEKEEEDDDEESLAFE